MTVGSGQMDFLDAGIRRPVEILCAAGIETFESCEGGSRHAYPEPTIRFYGDRSEGFKALAVALQNDLPVSSIRRIWRIIDGEPTGPYWEMVFWRKVDYLSCEEVARDYDKYVREKFGEFACVNFP